MYRLIRMRLDAWHLPVAKARPDTLNKCQYYSNVSSSCVLGNAYLISTRQVSLRVDFTLFATY